MASPYQPLQAAYQHIAIKKDNIGTKQITSLKTFFPRVFLSQNSRCVVVNTPKQNLFLTES